MWEFCRRLEPLKKLQSTVPRPSVDRKLHLADLLVYVLHEVYHEVHQLVLVHLLGVEVGDEEGDVVALHRLAPQDDEVVCAHHQEPHKLVAEDALDVITLLDGDGHTQGVDGGFNQDLLLVVARHYHGVHHQLLARPHLHLRLVVPLHDLAVEVV